MLEFTDWIGDSCIVEDDYDYYQAQQEYIDYTNECINRFFIGLNPRWQMYKFLPVGLNIMYSAGSFWNGKDDWCRPVKKFPKLTGLSFLDSGGYGMLLQ